ncbi:hypothetical protein [Parendozoicomonas sp. Alg238-R29]|uniref:hypothetical protein n=1 Tax=Parendozoicomonas sp. Alg238-R29 TaxID=2993446 RepID=UPI00248DC231|nr:hypothetical protein [Parendozoicomonas sp. Alg238-R29]
MSMGVGVYGVNGGKDVPGADAASNSRGGSQFSGFGGYLVRGCFASVQSFVHYQTRNFFRSFEELFNAVGHLSLRQREVDPLHVEFLQFKRGTVKSAPELVGAVKPHVNALVLILWGCSSQVEGVERGKKVKELLLLMKNLENRPDAYFALLKEVVSEAVNRAGTEGEFLRESLRMLHSVCSQLTSGEGQYDRNAVSSNVSSSLDFIVANADKFRNPQDV